MIITRVIDAMRFLTIIPMGRRRTPSEHDLAESLSYFPVTGFVQGIGIAVLAYTLLRVMSPGAASIFTLAFYVCITGGFHQDGLSDTFDALSIKSSGNLARDRERRLKVMKDSSIGPMGVIAVVLILIMKYALLESILHRTSIIACTVLLILPAFSKWAMVAGMYRSRPAAPGGLGSLFMERIKMKHVVLSTALFCALTFLSYALGYTLSHSLRLTLVPVLFVQMLVVLLISLVLKNVFTRRFGGLTGDNFGALHEFAEIVYLTLAVVLV